MGFVELMELIHNREIETGRRPGCIFVGRKTLMHLDEDLEFCLPIRTIYDIQILYRPSLNDVENDVVMA